MWGIFYYLRFISHINAVWVFFKVNEQQPIHGINANRERGVYFHNFLWLHR